MRKCVILAAVAVALCSLPVFATTWSLTGDYLSGSNPNGAWQYGTASYMGSSIPSFMFSFPTPSPMTDLDGIWNVHSSAEILRAETHAVGYYFNQNASDVTMSTGFYYTGAGTLHAGEMALFTGNGGWMPTARWRATADGDYTFNVDFRRVSNALLGVYVATGSGDNSGGTVTNLFSNFITNDNPTRSYSGTVHLLAGQFIDFGLTAYGADGINHDGDMYQGFPHGTLQAVAVNATVSEAVTPEPSSLFALAMSGIAAGGMMIRRRR